MADSISVGGQQITLYSGAELVQESPAAAATVHSIVLGALEKVNNELVPERTETLRGIKNSYTWYLPEARRTSDVGSFFEQQLNAFGQLLFQCKGRDCGSSSSWANTVFNRPILYGPEQHQHYYVAKTADGIGFLAVYVGQRATRKIYLHIEFVAAGTGAGGEEPSAVLNKEPLAVPDKKSISSNDVLVALMSSGRYVFTPSSDDEYPPELVRIVAEALSGSSLAVVLVVHDQLREEESLDAAVSRSWHQAETLVAAIRADTAEAIQIDARGLGPLAPSAIHGTRRIELVMPRQQ